MKAEINKQFATHTHNMSSFIDLKDSKRNKTKKNVTESNYNCSCSFPTRNKKQH